ncbi:hypothetical protein D3C86_1355960 [compost metagenome]
MQRLERQPHARSSARRQVLHQHIGLLQQLLENDLRFLLLEIQRDAFLGAIGPDEMRSHAAHTLVIATGEVAAAGPFDLDHPRTQVRQLPRAKRRGNGVFEADHGDAIEGAQIQGFISHGYGP